MARVIIVGGGASGVLLAAHLLRDRRPGLLVTLVEQREEFGAGVAYSTADPEHLLNVRASNMSAFPDDTEHFFRWLRQRAPWTGHGVFEASSFAPRYLYREYLANLLAPRFVEGRLRLVRAEAVSMSETASGVAVHFRDGSSRLGDRAVLATGNEGPRLPAAPWRHDGWSNSAIPPIAADAPVVIVGSGLTMADWALTLLYKGHRGPITALSRHGLMPREHRAASVISLETAGIPFGAPLSKFTSWLRRRIRRVESGEGDWRGVIDALRPHTQRLWQELSLRERSRFLRHARPWWDQHRHRIAPEAADRLAAARASGQFRVVAARLAGFQARDGGVDVLIEHRATQRPERLHAQAVFECRGRASDVTQTENPILRFLLASGLARPDPLRLGLDVTADCALIGRDGRISEKIFAVGPVTSGVFWEITAVPDIRVQAARLAERLNAPRGGSASREPAYGVFHGRLAGLFRAPATRPRD